MILYTNTKIFLKQGGSGMFIRDMNRNNAEMRQHFSIRKLTVGGLFGDDWPEFLLGHEYERGKG
jgi:hypothetical protein